MLFIALARQRAWQEKRANIVLCHCNSFTGILPACRSLHGSGGEEGTQTKGKCLWLFCPFCAGMVLLRRAALALAQFPAECSSGVCRGLSQTGRTSGRAGRGSGRLQLVGQMLAGPGWDREQRQPNPPTPTEAAPGKRLVTRNAVTRVDGTEGHCSPASSARSFGTHLAQSHAL